MRYILSWEVGRIDQLYSFFCFRTNELCIIYWYAVILRLKLYYCLDLFVSYVDDCNAALCWSSWCYSQWVVFIDVCYIKCTCWCFHLKTYWTISLKYFESIETIIRERHSLYGNMQQPHEKFPMVFTVLCNFRLIISADLYGTCGTNIWTCLSFLLVRITLHVFYSINTFPNFLIYVTKLSMPAWDWYDNCLSFKSSVSPIACRHYFCRKLRFLIVSETKVSEDLWHVVWV